MRKDLESMLKSGVKIRLVKGAYAGDTRDFHEIQSSIITFAETLSEIGVGFALGTHDPEVLAWVFRETDQSKDRIELGMLKGLSDKTKLDFARNGWKVAEYVPFGSNATAYVQRRLEYLQQLKILGRSPAP
jgi:proline dehydrogenase